MVSAGPCFLLFSAVSGLAGCVPEKGPLIAGFPVFSSRISEYDPFVNNVPKGDNLGQNGPESSQSGVKRDQIRAHPGPREAPSLRNQVPGSIQHLPRISLDRLWLPGSIDRRYGNMKRTMVRWVPLAREEKRPLSPGHCSLAVSMPDVVCTAVQRVRGVR